MGDKRGAVVDSRSCVVVLVEAKGPRGTRTSRDVQARGTSSVPHTEGLEAAVAKQDGKCRRGFADPRKGSRDSLSFLFIGGLCKCSWELVVTRWATLDVPATRQLV